MQKILLITFISFGLVPAWGQDTTRLSMLFLGDIMQHDSQIADAYDKASGTYNYGPCFQYIKPYIEGVDVAVGNLEVTLAGRPYKGYPQFSAPDELLAALNDIGMDVIVTANNHSVDRGRAGIERTLAMLDSFRIPHTGTFRNAAERENTYPLIVERNGFRLAILNYTYGTNGLPVAPPNIVNRLDTATIAADLRRATELEPDVIIVFPHWGLEYQRLPSQEQKVLTEFFFHHGADLVVGSHPHVVQPMEWRKNEGRLVAYSLGNFVSGQRKRYTDGGVMLRLELEKVTFPDASSLTRLDTAGYILEWVYRTNDVKRDYYVLPVAAVEAEPERYLDDAVSVEAFKTFVSDARSLFGKHNLAVAESSGPAAYYVQFEATDTLGVRKYLEERSGIDEIIDVNFPVLQVGPMTHPDAVHLHDRIRSDLPVERLMIRKE